LLFDLDFTTGPLGDFIGETYRSGAQLGLRREDVTNSINFLLGLCLLGGK
jgi:hypothetical protein